MKWAGHMVKMKDGRLPKTSRQQIKKVAENEEDQDGKLRRDDGVTTDQPHPYKRETRGRTIYVLQLSK